MDNAKKFDDIIGHTLADYVTNVHDLKSFSWINNRLMEIERCFINPRGMPGEESKRHLLFSVSSKNKYRSVTMSTIHDTVDLIFV